MVTGEILTKTVIIEKISSKQRRNLQIYSCITLEIIAIPNIIAYDRVTVSYYGCVPLLTAAALFVTVIIFFIAQTYRAIRFAVASARLKRMQRIYLGQLVLQAFIPFILVIIPGVSFIIIMIFEIYGLTCKF